MPLSINPLDILPDEKSNSEDWVAFYDALVKRYGKKAANTAFVKRWSLRGNGGKADIVSVEKATGLDLQKNVFESAEKSFSNSVDFVGGFFNTLGTGSKIAFYSALGLSILLVGGVIVRVVTLSATDAGKAAGAAAKIYTGKP